MTEPAERKHEMNKNGYRAIELLMDGMNQGIVFVDKDKKIQHCNRKAKEITGIVFDAHTSHEEGQLEEGDIVIIADNKLGGDDGNLSTRDLEKLNINDSGIKDGDMLVAVGVYKNKKIEPQYKHMRGHRMDMHLRLDVNYFGFHIVSSIDTEHKETLIEVNESKYRLNYYNSVGNVVILDGATGNVKFFQAIGYGVRHEEIGELLREQPWQAKNIHDGEADVTGEEFLNLFDKSDLSERLFAVVDGTKRAIYNRLYEINKRPFICNIVPWYNTQNPEDYLYNDAEMDSDAAAANPESDQKELPAGAFLMIRDAQNLEVLISERNEIIRQIEEKEEVVKVQEHEFPEDAFVSFAGKSNKANEVKYMAWKASKSKFNVIITGESGTGKSKLAREIHMMGNPASPFIEVNCNAIAPTLFESELFGYVGGAFTGAKTEGKVGFFEAANKGTIFLDEIGEIPLDIQVKLLQVLQNKIIYRVGSSKPIKVDVRVIAATNKNLEEEVANGRFRQDLFYRINVFPIDIPPIRERKGDLYLLINHILKKICDTYGLEQKQFSGEALQKMIAYNWPGNVRELENAIERAITLCDTNIIYSEHLKIGKGSIPTTMKEMLAKEEERILEMTLMKYNGDKNKAMKELDMSKTVFYEKLKKYDIK